MVRNSTILKINSLLDSIEKSGLSIKAYFNTEGKSPSYFYNLISKIKEEGNNPEIVRRYENLKNYRNSIENLYEEEEELEIPGLEAEHTEDAFFSLPAGIVILRCPKEERAITHHELVS